MIAFAKFRVLFDLEVPSSHPTLVQICLEIGKELTVKETRDFFRAHKKSHPYMSHTLVVAISNIFTVMTKGAKNPEALRRMRYTNEVTPSVGRHPIKMTQDLLGQIRMAVMSGSLGYLFATRPSTYKLFFPEESSTGSTEGSGTSATGEGPKRKKKGQGQEGGPTKNPKTEGNTKGCIVNATGKPFRLPNTLEIKYCNAFLDAGIHCKYKKACTFKHVTLPKGVAANDLPKIRAYVESTPGLSFSPSVKFSTEGETNPTAGADVSSPEE